MAEGKKIIPYRVGKENIPKVEEVITKLLDDKMQKNALDLILYLRNNKTSILRTYGNSETK